MSTIKKGEIFSETQFYTVKEVNSNNVILTDEFGNDISMNQNYINDLLKSADRYDKIEKVNKTDLSKIILENKGIAMTICFVKQPEKKLVREFKEEVAKWTENVKEAFLQKGLSGLEQFATTPVSKFKDAETRVIKGRHYGHMNESGRLDFVDMEKVKSVDSKGADTRIRQIDTRTLIYAIIDGVKYEVK